MPVSRFLTTFGKDVAGEPDVPRNAQGEATVDYCVVSYVPAAICLVEVRLSAAQLTAAKGLTKYLWVLDYNPDRTIAAWQSNAATIRTWAITYGKFPAGQVNAFPLDTPADFKRALNTMLTRSAKGAGLQDDDFIRAGLGV